MPEYLFRPFTRAHLPMAARWLRTPEVVRWWGDPGAELALIEEDLDEPLMSQWIVEHDGRPFAYLQYYRVDSWPQPHFANLPEAAHALDTFVGEPAMLGRGHGGAYLRQVAMKLVSEGAPLLVIDPDAENHRARRAYARAGFRLVDVRMTTSGPIALMRFPPP